MSTLKLKTVKRGRRKCVRAKVEDTDENDVGDEWAGYVRKALVYKMKETGGCGEDVRRERVGEDGKRGTEDVLVWSTTVSPFHGWI